MAAKCLWIGVTKGSEVVLTIPVPLGREVTIGSDAGTTIPLSGDGVPGCVVLLAPVDGGHRLRFQESMDLKVRVGEGQTATAPELIASGVATQVDQGWELPLDEERRGRVKLGDYGVLFKFDAPPD